LFSVVIPLYNGGHVLPRAVASVQAQSYQNFEILVVDDGSTDGSLRVARELAAADPRITVFAIDNSGGPARPRNYAIQRCRGEFIAFLDQDDWWVPNKLELQLAQFRCTDAALVYGDAWYLDPLNPVENGLLMSQRPIHQERIGGLPAGQVQRDIIRGNFASQLTVVIRRSWMERLGPLDERAVGVDCYEYLIRVALAGGAFGVVPLPVGVHDRGVDNLSRDQHTALTQSLRLFKQYAPRYPEYGDDWRFRIREYERALARSCRDRTRTRALPWRARLEAFCRLLWLRPNGKEIAAALVGLLPPSVVQGVRNGRAAMGRRLRR
jgi:glycosyltransferase involved in cell wall biosynthesis